MMQTLSTNSTIQETLVGGPVATHVRFDGSLGAMLIGLIFASILFGITNVQSLVYYQKSATDPKNMKWTVMVLWLLDAFHLALISHAIYRYLVTDFGSLIAITRSSWSLCVCWLPFSAVMFTHLSLAAGYCNGFERLHHLFVLCVSRMDQSRLLAFGALTLSLGRFVSGMALGIKIFTLKSVLEVTKNNLLIYLNMSFCVASDLWCALCLCYYLAKNRGGPKTSHAINTLMLYIISTGLLTSLCSILCLALISAMPHSYSYIGVYFCLSKLYFNGFLGMLNARNHLREEISRTSDQEAYRLPEVINFSPPSNTRRSTSFSMVQVASVKIPSSVYKE
ncbi:hypothetical protein ACEPAI_8862 [Sanghuangporus weigelae]